MQAPVQVRPQLYSRLVSPRMLWTISAWLKGCDFDSGLGVVAAWNMRPSATHACAVDTARRGGPNEIDILYSLSHRICRKKGGWTVPDALMCPLSRQ